MYKIDLLPTVEKCYLAYYGRGADYQGAHYWTMRLYDDGGNLKNIIDAFANSAESQAMYGGKSNEAKVNAIYQQLFGRSADAEGLNFYVGNLASGKMTHGAIALDILNGASGSDLTIINSKLESVGFNDSQRTFMAADFGESAYWLSQKPPITEAPDVPAAEGPSHIPANLSGEYKLINYKGVFDNGNYMDMTAEEMAALGKLAINGSSVNEQVSVFDTYAERFGTPANYTMSFVDEDTLAFTNTASGITYERDFSVTGNILQLQYDHEFGKPGIIGLSWEFIPC